ncbi:MAG TPA: bifunctional hydroxymethylpyrimidine kinase/phosphomethylpyrimidine kinase [Candidatus Dormibacteraeota bacterium]|jgi:hydroxymethylpyrimidine/phosphomethylpyrimidine kinase|nr:bifunctional hydroxymethylpyrimidine kinase/phosphomethylpyrimidine kinase [Candidatus Dormibacteraeota bacterium]
MPQRKFLPVALTIAGSDSGGGAGIQADLKTFAALGVHGASAIACLTAQNPKRVLAVEPCSPEMLRQQIEAVFEELQPTAVKTGMLCLAGNVRVVAEFFKKRKCPLVVDPLMISTSGAKLIEPEAIKILQEKLLPLATLVTPNIDEAEIMTGQKIASVEEMREVARKIHSRLGCAALVKGGHLQNAREAVDIFFDGKTELLLNAPFVKGVRTHGTGCTYSAAICAALALGNNLPHAVKIGKKFVTAVISNSYRIGNHFALNHFQTTRACITRVRH